MRGDSRVFIKVFPRNRLPPTMLPALPALAELGLPEAPRPRASLSGALYERLGRDIVVVFEHVDGVRILGDAIDREWVGNLLRRLHQRPRHPVMYEQFRWPHTRTWPKALARARAPSTDPIREVLRHWLDEQADALDQAWTAFAKLTTACRGANFDLVLTHGDWPFNVLRSPDGSLHLVDWDELLLAPRERDTWFASDDEVFLRGYGDQTLDQLATAFYLHWRYFDDLLGFFRAVVDGDDPGHVRANALVLLNSAFLAEMRTRVAELGKS